MICQHCGNKNAHETVAEYKDSSTYDDGMKWSEGYYYQLLNCKACREVTLIKYLWSELWTPQIDWEMPILLFPSLDSLKFDLPGKIRDEYDIARKVRYVDPNAYAVMLGKVLERICIDRKADGNSLYQKLEFLHLKGEIPTHLIDIAHSIRTLRNIGAHTSFKKLNKQDSFMLDNLVQALLSYLYIVPKLAAKAKQRIENEYKTKT